MDEKTLSRFWSKVNKTGPVPTHQPELGPCWTWTATRSAKGYGNFQFDGAVHQAHRVAFRMARGRWPEPCCLHKCDNPSCVRDSHLFEGTNADNVADRQVKQRSSGGSNGGTARGEQIANSKLTVDDVREIRRMRAQGATLVAIAEAFGVAHPTINRITLGKAWRHVLG